MSRIIAVAAAFALTIASAAAAPGFGGSSVSTNNTNSAAVESRPSQFLAFVLSAFRFELPGAVGTSVSEQKSGVSKPQEYECEEAKAARDAKEDEEQRTATRGPEPVFLAF